MLFPSTSLSVEGIGSISIAPAIPEELYLQAAEQYGSALDRLASAYELDKEKRRDLRQDIHFQLWRSFQSYDGRCSLRTWTFRIAHHVAVSYVIRERRIFSTLVSLEELESIPGQNEGQNAAAQHVNLTRLFSLIQQLKPLDRQVIISWLEGIDAASIGEITGLAPGNVAVRISRIKRILARRFNQRGNDAS